MKGLVILAVVVFSCMEAETRAQAPVAGIQESFDPIQKQLGELSKIIRKSVQDTSDQVRASFNNIADAGQALVAPIPEKERANAPDQFKRRAEDFLRSFQTAGRELYNQGNANVRSFAIAEKGMAESTDEVLKNLERSAMPIPIDNKAPKA